MVSNKTLSKNSEQAFAQIKKIELGTLVREQ